MVCLSKANNNIKFNINIRSKICFLSMYKFCNTSCLTNFRFNFLGKNSEIHTPSIKISDIEKKTVFEYSVQCSKINQRIEIHTFQIHMHYFFSRQVIKNRCHLFGDNPNQWFFYLYSFLNGFLDKFLQIQTCNIKLVCMRCMTLYIMT